MQLPSPKSIDLNLEIDVDGKKIKAHHVVVGVPHIIVFTQDPDTIDIEQMGRKIRFHKKFQPAGANVNFVRVKNRETLYVRTYERGVEEETFACGTGAMSASVAAHLLGYTDKHAKIKTRKNFNLEVCMDGENVYLQGPAEITFKGEFYFNPDKI